MHLNIVNGLLDGSAIYNGDFADPFALHVGATVYVYASDTTTAHIPVLAADPTTDFAGQYLGDALPTLPSWTFPGYQWGPAVWARPDGTYVLYYATPDQAPSSACIADAQRAHVTAGLCYLAWSKESRQCLSRAVASSPTGPFVDDSTGPFICPRRQGGAIDPSVFVSADGTPYLVWKSDGNGYGLPTAIYSERLTSDGLAVAGPPHRLIGATQPWEGNLVEGPSMVEAGGAYWLFYSANDWDTPNYAIGVARCRTVDGPCQKPLDHPLLSTANDPANDQGPGGQEFLDVGGFVWMVHHGWLPGQAGTPNGQRRLYVDLVAFDGPHGQPALAAGPLAAALADVIDGATVPGQPTNPPDAYLDEVHATRRRTPSSPTAPCSRSGTARARRSAVRRPPPRARNSSTALCGKAPTRSVGRYRSPSPSSSSARSTCPASARTSSRCSITRDHQGDLKEARP